MKHDIDMVRHQHGDTSYFRRYDTGMEYTHILLHVHDTHTHPYE